MNMLYLDFSTHTKKVTRNTASNGAQTAAATVVVADKEKTIKQIIEKTWPPGLCNFGAIS